MYNDYDKYDHDLIEEIINMQYDLTVGNSIGFEREFTNRDIYRVEVVATDALMFAIPSDVIWTCREFNGDIWRTGGSVLMSVEEFIDMTPTDIIKAINEAYYYCQWEEDDENEE